MPILPEYEKPSSSSEKVPLVEVGGEIPQTPAEKEGLVQRVDAPILEKPITSGGQVVVSSPAPQQSKIVLPLSQQSYINPKNWHKPVVYAISWLLRWADRLRKIYPNRTSFNG